mgnify:FL=1
MAGRTQLEQIQIRTTEKRKRAAADRAAAAGRPLGPYLLELSESDLAQENSRLRSELLRIRDEIDAILAA